MPADKKEVTISIKPYVQDVVQIRIVGDTPLIIHEWSEKARRELIDKTEFRRKLPRNPFAEAASTSWWINPKESPFPRGISKDLFESMWIPKYISYTEEDFVRDLTDKKFGFPVKGIKAAGISAVYRNGMSKDKVSLQGTFFIPGIGVDQLAGIIYPGSVPEIREDNVKIGMGTADLRYRCMFNDWSMNLEVRVNRNGKLTINDVLNLIELGGRTNGIGEFRVEKGGNYGAFHIDQSNII